MDKNIGRYKGKISKYSTIAAVCGFMEHHETEYRKSQCFLHLTIFVLLEERNVLDADIYTAEQVALELNGNSDMDPSVNSCRKIVFHYYVYFIFILENCFAYFSKLCQ